MAVDVTGFPELPDSDDPHVWLAVIGQAEAALEAAHLARWEVELDGLPAVVRRGCDAALGRPAPPLFFDLGGGTVVELGGEDR